VRALSELVETDDPAWPEIEAAVAAASYSIEVLDADPGRADDELVKLQVTTRSWLGAVVHRVGADRRQADDSLFRTGYVALGRL
jgi:hypothetical protein